ncbi:MAG: DUF4124 domain-containing protein [Chromatiales bacterium]|nr:DUF4124 domain-containing protein [Chromatiales bacterium]
MDNQRLLQGGRTVVAAMLLGAAMGTHAEYYKWTDSEGQVHYSQKPPAELQRNKVERMNLKVHTSEPVGEADSEQPRGMLCGELTLPPPMPDPVVRITQLRRLLERWQKFVDENSASTDEAVRSKIKDHQCGINYVKTELASLAEVKEKFEQNYEKASVELAERKQLVRECEEGEEGEEGPVAVAECRGEHRRRIEELEQIMRNLEAHQKTLTTP